jgi:hypothetical protein
MKPTAVDWIFEYLWENHNLSFSDNIFKKAKAIEKEQIENAYTAGNAEWTPVEYANANHYYNETYNHDTTTTSGIDF